MTITAAQPHTPDAARYTATAPQVRLRPRPVRVCLEMSIERTSPIAGELAGADAVWPGALRRIVRTSLRSWGLQHLVQDAELLISELVTNALLYGCGELGVRLYFSTSEFVIAVRDDSTEHPVLCQAAPGDAHGHGLFLVDALAAAWGVSGDGTTTWCALPLSRPFAGTTTAPLRTAEEVYA